MRPFPRARGLLRDELPDWRLALDVAAIAVFFLGLGALVVLMVMVERPWP